MQHDLCPGGAQSLVRDTHTHTYKQINHHTTWLNAAAQKRGWGTGRSSEAGGATPLGGAEGFIAIMQFTLQDA